MSSPFVTMVVCVNECSILEPQWIQRLQRILVGPLGIAGPPMEILGPQGPLGTLGPLGIARSFACLLRVRVSFGESLGKLGQFWTRLGQFWTSWAEFVGVWDNLGFIMGHLASNVRVSFACLLGSGFSDFSTLPGKS